jgi:hypothetical protein
MIFLIVWTLGLLSSLGLMIVISSVEGWVSRNESNPLSRWWRRNICAPLVEKFEFIEDE